MLRVGGWVRERDQQFYTDIHSTNSETSPQVGCTHLCTRGTALMGDDELLPDRS